MIYERGMGFFSSPKCLEAYEVAQLDEALNSWWGHARFVLEFKRNDYLGYLLAGRVQSPKGLSRSLVG
jgi:hypothetical protein